MAYPAIVLSIPDAGDIDEVLAILDRVIDHARTRGARWGAFAGLYRQVTRAVKTGINDGRFDDGARMSRFDAVFANRYLAALRQHLAGQRASSSWRVAFAAAERADVIAVQHLLLGINAHINLDLGLAVVQAGLSPAEFRNDFLAINTILGESLDHAQAALNTVSPALATLDRLLGDADETLGLFVIARGRDQAWMAATIADALPEDRRAFFETTLDAVAAHLGRRIARPGLPTSAAVALIRRQEAWTVPELIDALSG